MTFTFRLKRVRLMQILMEIRQVQRVTSGECICKNRHEQNAPYGGPRPIALFCFKPHGQYARIDPTAYNIFACIMCHLLIFQRVHDPHVMRNRL